MQWKTLFALASMVLSSSLPAMAAPPIPRGKEFRIDTNASTSTSSRPQIAAFPDGGFVVVWAGPGVYARFLDSAGKPSGGVKRLPGVLGLDQVLADRDGSFLVVWTDYTVLPSNVYVRRFNRDGTPRGGKIRANLLSTYDRYEAVAAIGPDGRFAVAWEADIPIPDSENGTYTSAVGRIFTANGTPLTPEITLLAGEEPTGAGDDTIHAFPSSLALRPNGTLAALVQQRGSCFQSYLREISREGEPADSVHSLGSIFCGVDLSRSQRAASLVVGKDGSLVAAWTDYSVQAQRFAPNGTFRGDWFHVNPTNLLRQWEPAVALQAGGTFVIAWTEDEDDDGDGEDIFGRAFAANGTPRTPVFQINVTAEGDQGDPAIATSRQGPAVVVWSSPTGVRARVLSPER